MNFKRIKKNYDTNLWSKSQVRDAYKAEIITFIEYYIITKDFEDEDIPEGFTRETFREYLDKILEGEIPNGNNND